MSSIPNLVFVLTDEQKASGLGLYGGAMLKTPAIERLASEGVLVENAFTPCPLCVPSRGTLLTGKYPRHHGLWFNDQRLPGSMPTWFEVLKGVGYALGLFGKNHCLPEHTIASLFDTCFGCSHEGYEPDPADPELAAVNAWLRRPELLTAPWAAEAAPFPLAVMPTHVITNHALSFIREAPQPFCIWLSYPDPHTPLQCPEPYASLYSSEHIPLPVFDEDRFATKPVRQAIASRMFGADKVEPDQIRRCIGIYYGMQRFIDDELGRILDFLDESGHADDTLVVFTSDHGDYMGEHRLIRKSLAFYDALIRVPLVIRLPGVLPAGTRFDRLVSLVDLAPTILDLAELPTLSGFDGCSLASVLRTPDCSLGWPVDTESTIIFGEAGLAGTPPIDTLTGVPDGPFDGRFPPWGSRREAWTGPGWMVRTKTHKFIEYETGEGEFYDLVNDPGELHNLYGSAAAMSAQRWLSAHLTSWIHAS